MTIIYVYICICKYKVKEVFHVEFMPNGSKNSEIRKEKWISHKSFKKKQKKKHEIPKFFLCVFWLRHWYQSDSRTLCAVSEVFPLLHAECLFFVSLKLRALNPYVRQMNLARTFPKHSVIFCNFMWLNEYSKSDMKTYSSVQPCSYSYCWEPIHTYALW